MKIVIYQTSDLHGYVYPTDYVKPQDLGILKIGSYLLEDEKKYDASLKIDCGDVIQGSALAGYLVQKGLEVNPIIEGLRFVGYDAYVLGNHEFNYGLDYLKRSYTSVQDHILNANIKGLPFDSKPYEIYDFNGFKVGVIGLTTAFIEHWEQPFNIEGCTFLNPVDMYAKYEEELKAQADFIIVAYHGGFEKSIDDEMIPTETLNHENQGSELIERFPSINVILSGHQHRSFITKIRDVITSQPLHNGQNFTKIVIDTETLEIAYQLVQVKDLQVEMNPMLEKMYTEIEEELQTYLKQTIASFDHDLQVEDVFTARLKGHPFINFLHKVQLDASKADVSVISLFDSAIGFSKDVTVKEILINYPYPNTFKVLEISGKGIKEAMEKTATYFVLQDGKPTINPSFLFPKVQNYNYDTFGGITYEIDLRKPMYERVVSVKKDGVELEDDQMLTIVMSNYRASNTAIYPSYEGLKEIKDIQQEMSELLIAYFEQHPHCHVDEQSNYVFTY